MMKARKNNLNRISEIVRKQGIYGLIKKFTQYIIKYEKRYIFQINVKSCRDYKPKVGNYSFDILCLKEQLYDLLERGFSITQPFDVSNIERRLDQHQIAFCIFIHKNLAHCSWIVMDNEEIEVPVNINYATEAFIWGVITSPQYRGLGLYPCALLRVCTFLREKGKERVIVTSLKGNMPAIRAVTKVGFSVCGKLYYLKVFLWEFWIKKMR